MFKLYVTFLSCVFFLVISFAADAAVREIELKGNERISSTTVQSYFKIRLGEEVTQNQIDAGIKNLYSSGFFSDVKAYTQGEKLVIEVSENPMIAQIAFEGNSKVKDDVLVKELSMHSRSIFSLSKLKNDINRIIFIYQKKGIHSTKVEAKVIKLSQNRINLVYEIKEGKKALIQKISFVGNKAFTSRQLGRVISSREEAWYRFFSSADTFDMERVQLDVSLLEEFYAQEGYADFQVLSAVPEISQNHDAFLISFVLDEGELYKFGEIKVVSKIKNIDSSSFQKLLKVKGNRFFNKLLLDESVDAITEALGNQGYAFADVNYEIIKDAENKIANITFMIQEGQKVYVNKINIHGNIRTLDKVIRREFRINEGDPYNASAIERSKQRIDNLGYFGSVEFDQKRADQDKVDIDVKVKEASTGSMNFSVGYNSQGGVMGGISLAENNLLGKGQIIEADFKKAQRFSEFRVAFTEPYFMNRRLLVGFDVFNSSKNMRRESSFASTATGGTLRMGYDLTEYLAHELRYSLRREKIYNVPATASIFVQEQKGLNVVSLVGQSLIYNRLDHSIDPTSGYILTFNQDVAALGGTAKYIQNQVAGSYYYPIYKKDVILVVGGRGGNVAGLFGKRVRLLERFFIGQDYIAGFDTSGIGPRDRVTKDALGGNTYYTGNVELRFPLGLPKEVALKGALFTEFGSSFGVDSVNKSQIYDSRAIRASYGAGLLWDSPLGSIRLDYGVAFQKESFDKTKNIRFSFGNKF